MIAYNVLSARAEAALSADAWAYYAAGSGDEQTLDEAAAAWREWRFRPRVLRDVSSVTTSTRMLGTDLPAPIAIAPTAAHGYACLRVDLRGSGDSDEPECAPADEAKEPMSHRFNLLALVVLLVRETFPENDQWRGQSLCFLSECGRSTSAGQ
jgi:pimeloyl-ACP methyl ester carboxylesterase